MKKSKAVVLTIGFLILFIMCISAGFKTVYNMNLEDTEEQGNMKDLSNAITYYNNESTKNSTSTESRNISVEQDILDSYSKIAQ